jgi:hypothetical protein
LRVASKVALSLLAIAAIGSASTRASAGGMDITPERLVLQPGGMAPGDTCQGIAANPELVAGAKPGSPYAGHQPNDFSCRPDNLAWRNLMSELGMAVAPTAFHPARTTGYGGFALTLEASYTKINADQFSTGIDGSRRQYWHDGTRGSVDPNNKQFSIVNNSPDSILQVYSLKARKGLPFGFEVVGSLGYLANTSLWVGGADIRWALLEGFRTGIPGVIPDISIGGGVRTVGGSDKFFLTVVGIDGQISKQIAIADSGKLTPYIGAQRVIIFADSTIVDSTPNVDPLQQCGYLGADPVTGSPMCRNKLSNGVPNNGDFNNNIVFNKARIHRWRGLVGVNYRYESLFVAGQFMMDLSDPNSENNNVVGDKQWTTVFEAGVFF